MPKPISTSSLSGALSPTMVARTASALIRGHGVGIPRGDICQLPAVFIIDATGSITHSHIGTDASDHPRPRKILDALA